MAKKSPRSAVARAGSARAGTKSVHATKKAGAATKVRACSGGSWQARIEQDLAALAPQSPMNGLPRLLCDWLRDNDWTAAASQVPPLERRALLAAAGAGAFDRDCGGYASWLRKSTVRLDHIWSDEKRIEILRQHTQMLLMNLSDILEFSQSAHNRSWDEVPIVGDEHVRAALEEGRGLMVLAVHQSHPGLGFLHPAWDGIGISTVANLGDPSAPHSSLLLEGLKDRVEILPTTAAALRPMLSRLASGGCIAIYGDYLYPGTPGTLSMLFGKNVLISSAAVSLALRTGAAVIPVSVARQWPPESGGVTVRFGSPLPLRELDPREPAARDMAAALFGMAMELVIRRDPAVWRLWPALRYRWRTAAEAVPQSGQ